MIQYYFYEDGLLNYAVDEEGNAIFATWRYREAIDVYSFKSYKTIAAFRLIRLKQQ